MPNTFLASKVQNYLSRDRKNSGAGVNPHKFLGEDARQLNKNLSPQLVLETDLSFTNGGRRPTRNDVKNRITLRKGVREQRQSIPPPKQQSNSGGRRFERPS